MEPVEIEFDILQAIEFRLAHFDQTLREMGAYQHKAQQKEIDRLKRKVDILVRTFVKLGPVLASRVLNRALKQIAPEFKDNKSLELVELLELLNEQTGIYDNVIFTSQY